MMPGRREPENPTRTYNETTVPEKKLERPNSLKPGYSYDARRTGFGWGRSVAKIAFLVYASKKLSASSSKLALAFTFTSLGWVRYTFERQCLGSPSITKRREDRN